MDLEPLFHSQAIVPVPLHLLQVSVVVMTLTISAIRAERTGNTMETR